MLELPAFEIRLRQSTLQTCGWHTLRPELAARQTLPVMAWGVLSLHPNGHIREQAIERLCGGQASALRFLLLRLNDWVPQVRSAADRAVRARLTAEHLSEWLEVVGLLDALQSRSRHDHRWLNEAVAKLMCSSGSTQTLERALGSGERRVARWAMNAAMTLPDTKRRRFIDLGLANVDPVCRNIAASEVRRWTACPGRAALLQCMRENRLMHIRREALYAMVDAPTAARIAWLQESLLDAHRSIREAARHFLRSDVPEFDARAPYTRELACDSAANLRAAIAGLGETGGPDDCEWLTPFIEHADATIASAAVRAIAQLDGEHHIDLLIGLLSDARALIAREAMRGLIKFGDSVPREGLLNVVRASPHAHSARYALKVLLQRPWYEALADGLAAAGHHDSVVAQEAIDLLESFIRRPYRYAPTETQREDVERSLRLNEKRIPTELCERIRGVMA